MRTEVPSFFTRATNLVPGDNNEHEDIFLYRTATGQLFRAFDSLVNTEPNEASFYPDINQDGTKVVFESDATNLQSNGDITSGRQIFLWDLSSGGSGTIRTHFSEMEKARKRVLIMRVKP